MDAALPEPHLERLSELVGARLGLHFPRERWRDLARGVAAAAPDFRQPDAAACAQRLLAEPLSDADIERLATHLTVGETYFFRDRDLFDLLEQLLLPELLQAHGGHGPRLRIWSAGCASGEEPYSVAMLLDRLRPQAGPNDFTLLGTDINPAFLRRAAEGEYGAWSFRDTPAWVRNTYFQPREGGRWRLHERIRRRVAWGVLNLAEDSYPSLASNTHAMDLILCRNVLMYFSPAQAQAVVARLYRALRPGGWLVVTPAEMSGDLFASFTPVSCAGLTLYRKDGTQSICAPAPAAVPAPLAQMPVLQPGMPRLPSSARPLAAASSRPTPAPAASDPGAWLQAARDSANQGRFDAALSCCRQAIAADKLDPVAHYLLATIEQEQGQAEAAARSLVRALYLDPDFVLAHVGLAGLRRAQGRIAEAVRHFRRARGLLQACAEDEVVPESEGQHAGRLAEAMDLALANLEPAPSAARPWRFAHER